MDTNGNAVYLIDFVLLKNAIYAKNVTAILIFRHYFKLWPKGQLTLFSSTLHEFTFPI